ncbi:putative transposase, Ptta/En/Spm, plant [Helianthus debilis subsp. tardiflorus]
MLIPWLTYRGHYDVKRGCFDVNMRRASRKRMGRGLTRLEIMPTPMMVLIIMMTQMRFNLPLMLKIRLMQPRLMITLRGLISIGSGGSANGKVHRAIRTLFNECFDGAWATYRDVPKELLDRMFDRFRTRYNWDQANDEAIREGFENVLKDRFADIMSDYRTESAKKARVAGFDFPDDRLDFEAMSNFPPRFVHGDIWEELCMGWNTEAWKKKSVEGRNNRKKVDNDDVISRYTGGSRGYDEHRIILERALGRPPTFRELFLATHLTKESKKIFWDGLYDESLDGAEFCTARSRKAYEAYERSMLEKYGEGVTLHPVGDADLWERAQGRRGFGIGSSDPHFIVNGTPSSSSGSASYADYQRSQEQVKNLQAQVDMLQNRVEEAQQQVREEMREEMKEKCNDK